MAQLLFKDVNKVYPNGYHAVRRLKTANLSALSAIRAAENQPRCV